MRYEKRTYTVGELAKMSGVTTRTLRHYDKIGLLRPTQRGENDYRLYGYKECQRLSDIMVYRSLGVPLADIGPMLDERVGRLERLASHRRMLGERLDQLAGLIDAIDEMIDIETNGGHMAAEELFNGFLENPHEEEARERWGETDAYRESNRRVKGYSAEDWARYEAESVAVNMRLVELMQAGLAADSIEAMDAADLHRDLIHRWFYPCDHQFHRNLGDMYIADPRFTANIDKTAEGLAAYMRDAIAANAARHGVDGPSYC